MTVQINLQRTQAVCGIVVGIMDPGTRLHLLRGRHIVFPIEFVKSCRALLGPLQN